ncbi:MAG: DegV family protein [Anaerolineales bacterium]|jgi:DegV family protein with EDD domain
MTQVAIVTDSTAYIPADYVEKYDIRVAPQVLIWGEETYRDGVDIQPKEFYERLQEATVMPSTSQVSIVDFVEIFSELHEGGRKILAILVSDKLSGTISSAVQAKAMLPEAHIEIVDSETTAMDLGFHVLAVARAAQEGASIEVCKSLAEECKGKSGVVFVVDTLEFLHRSGRIGGATRFLGTALNIKPLLEVRDGQVEALEMVRTKRKAHNRLVELVAERTNGRSPLRLAVLNANAPDDANAVLENANEHLDADEVIFSEVSPVVGTVAGPGTVALAFMAG